jgi:PPOX class probable F420-dependent enzyme
VDLGAGCDFVRANHRAVLATTRADGTLQLSPVVLGLDGEGRVVISTRETAMKTANVRRRPGISACVMSDQFFGRWIQIDGSAEVVGLPQAMDGLVALYRQVAGEHPDWAEFREAMVSERRVLLRITIERVGPDRSG